MKSFKSFVLIVAGAASVLLIAPLTQSCDETTGQEPHPVSGTYSDSGISELEAVARIISELPVSLDNVKEVWDAVTASSLNGYDEEYPFVNLLENPGSGVGDDLISISTRASYNSPLRDLLPPDFKYERTRAGAEMLQIYWPYSEDWDGVSMPTITFDPENGAESNIAFRRQVSDDGSVKVLRLEIDEDYARSNPVWVINRNDDAHAVTPQVLEKICRDTMTTRAVYGSKSLKLKEFKAHRQFDPWFSGGSEFFLKSGSLKAFTAEVVSDMSRFHPQITDFMIKVKRKDVGKSLRYNSLLVSDWSSQLSECAFLITEDDGGKMTSWKSSGTVKIKSRSYGFEVEIPYHRNDDIVWRGKLSSNYLERNNGQPNRYGDVSISFVFN